MYPHVPKVGGNFKKLTVAARHVFLDWQNILRLLRMGFFSSFSPQWAFNCFATTKLFPRNSTHGDEVLYAWFIFTLLKKSYLYLQNTLSIVNQNPLSKERKGRETPTYLEVWCFAHGGESPSTLALA
jgi:hypothetical protein